MDEIEPLDEEKKKSPLIYIIAVFLVLLLVLMIFPHYGVKLDPQPEKIPTFEEVFLFEKNLSTETATLKTREDFLNFIIPENPVIKTTANRIASIACNGEKVCHAKAIYYFVRDNFDYIRDPVNFEYVEMPQDFMISGGGDCESGTLLMANLMEAVGINSQLVFVPGHAFLRIKLPEALSKYKRDFSWVYLDWTCKNCEFGEIPRTSIDAYMTFLDVS
ncbi:MAG: transglutaminase domain-containing protein [Nanoarchaeota archaeon]|nr:transglutaminase domain-containing protein [DPANN group archaeon]MBL7117079.1 transglutaminase domain-containing protein [Nanoarchaeota archaeon]